MKSFTKFIFSSFLFIISTNELLAAACCGGSLSRPTLITGDEKIKIQWGHSQNRIDRDVTATGLWKKREYKETLITNRLDFSYRPFSLVSFGATIPIVTRSKQIQGQKKEKTGLADISLTTSYEFLPDWSYHPYKPNGFIYFQFTLPTGKSLYEATYFGLDTRGKGLLNMGLGLLLLKQKKSFDFSFSSELHRSFKKEIEREDLADPFTIRPRLGGSISPEIGYSFHNFRIGFEMLFSYEEGQKIESSKKITQSSPERYTQISTSLSYMISQNYSITANYSDQTIFDSPLNTALGRIWGVSFITRRY